MKYLFPAYSNISTIENVLLCFCSIFKSLSLFFVKDICILAYTKVMYVDYYMAILISHSILAEFSVLYRTGRKWVYFL